jgi:hypothetical protein
MDTSQFHNVSVLKGAKVNKIDEKGNLDLLVNDPEQLRQTIAFKRQGNKESKNA